MAEQEPKDPLPDPAAVHRCTAAYSRGQEYSVHGDCGIQRKEKGQSPYPMRIEFRDVIIAFRITRSLAEKIGAYQLQCRKKSRTEAIINLLESALYIMENARRLDDPALVKYFRENLYNVQVVDDVMEWPQDRIEAMMGVLAGERERRFRLKIGKHYHG